MSSGHPFGADRSETKIEPFRVRPDSIKKEPGHCPDSFFFDVRERIRTPDTLVRSQVLYPAELHTHIQLKMPATGIEPVLCHHNRILSPARLPVPPRRHILYQLSNNNQMGPTGLEPVTPCL